MKLYSVTFQNKFGRHNKRSVKLFNNDKHLDNFIAKSEQFGSKLVDYQEIDPIEYLNWYMKQYKYPVDTDVNTSLMLVRYASKHDMKDRSMKELAMDYIVKNNLANI